MTEIFSIEIPLREGNNQLKTAVFVPVHRAMEENILKLAISYHAIV
jgi:hypothetical protein